jgi:predicted DNA-binding mobile mystery protein A
MNTEFADLRVQQIDRIIAPFMAGRSYPRPRTGWLRAIRQALGISLSELGERLHASRQLPQQFEKAESEDRITLRSLRAAANALDCDLVYALVPRADSLQQLKEKHLRADAERRVRSVEHSMALENQASGKLDETIDREINREEWRRGL